MFSRKLGLTFVYRWLNSSRKILTPLTTTKNSIYTSSYISFAQPTVTTHSHMLKKGEITPGISSDVYRERRKRLMEKIIANHSRTENEESVHLVIIPSASVVYMTQDIPYPFRQNTDFLYLTGFQEPDCAIVMYVIPKKFPEFTSTLFIPKQTAHKIRWEGCKMDLNVTTNFLNIDETLHMSEFENFLQAFIKSHKHFTIWYDYLNVSTLPVHQTMRNFMVAYTGSLSIESPLSMLHQLRLIKCDSEINLMRKTCKIAAHAMKEVMKFSYNNNLEAHLDAKMNFECQIRGADFPAFPSVVAGGDRANTIHYIENNQVIKPGDLVLMDAGCECYGYSSDLTRTWPVSGKFTESQKELYHMLLSIQEQLILLCKSKLSLDHLFKIMCKKLGKGLQELNIIPKHFSEGEANEAAFAFCPHHVGHYLGMDVHDTNTVSRGIMLQSGMVVTVEPGVYISTDNSSVPEEFKGLCIRIEDDILITRDGIEVLTEECPKQIDEIESLFKSS